MNLNSKKIATALLICVSFFSCTDDYFEFDKVILDELNPEFAIPLVNSSLTLEDILKNQDSSGVVTVGSDNVLEILYEGNVISSLGGTNVELPEVSISQNFDAIPSPPPGIQVPINYVDTINFDIQNGIEVDSLLLKNGNLVIRFNSTVRHPIEVIVDFPTLKNNNGTPISKLFVIPAYDGNNTSVAAEIIDLNEYLADFTLNGTSFNKIPFELNAVITGQAGVPPGITGNLQLVTEFRNLEFKDFYGYLGTNSIDLQEDTIVISLLKNFENGRFYIADPSLDITIKNSYGMPLNLGFEYLDAIIPNASNGKKAIDLGSFNPVSLLYPIKYGVEKTNLSLDKSNSNIPEVISDLLKKIAFDANAHPNPDTTTKIKNFFSDTSGIGLDVKLKLPMIGLASEFIIKDTIDFDFESAENLKSGLIRIRVSNGFPMQGKLQLLFVDEKFTTIDSLFPQGQKVIVPQALIGIDGKVTQRTDLTTDAIISENRLQALQNTKQLILKAELETTNANNAIPDTVKFLPSYKLDVAIGLKASILID